jgi:hypothetical protein
VPFGGFGASGIGRENGVDALREYTETKAVWVELTGATATPSRWADMVTLPDVRVLCAPRAPSDPHAPFRKDTMPTPEITAALQAAGDAIGRLDETLAGLSEGDHLHLAHRDGGWTAAQLVSHINMSVLLWTAALTRVANDPELAFVFRKEIGHDVFGYPPPRTETARRQLASTRRTLATCVPALI